MRGRAVVPIIIRYWSRNIIVSPAQVLVMQTANFCQPTLPYRLILAFSLEHQERAEGLVLKCLKKLNKSFHLPRESEQEEAVGELSSRRKCCIFLSFSQLSRSKGMSMLVLVFRSGVYFFSPPAPPAPRLVGERALGLRETMRGAREEPCAAGLCYAKRDGDLRLPERRLPREKRGAGAAPGE